jgi:hypothetical protein
MILLCEHPAAAAGAKVENGFSFSKRVSASFAPAVWMRERPINTTV